MVRGKGRDTGKVRGGGGGERDVMRRNGRVWREWGQIGRETRRVGFVNL